jgi:hypothetical protein
MVVEFHVLSEVVLDGRGVFAEAVAGSGSGRGGGDLVLGFGVALGAEVSRFADEFNPFSAFEAEEDLRVAGQDAGEFIFCDGQGFFNVAF